MSINGVLEDLALADVLQFIHLGRRTGTLYMWQDDEHRAEIGFHDGKIVSAWTPGQHKLGQLLEAAEVIDRETLEAALAEQREDDDRNLGQILVARGAIEREDILRVLREQVESTIFELVTWKHGRFHFEVDELHPVDGFELATGELLEALDLNTQMLLLEATRIFDERHREQVTGEEDAEGLSALDRRLRLAGFGRTLGPGERTAPEDRGEERSGSATAEPILESVRCQVVSRDSELTSALRRGLPAELARVVSVRLREAGNRMPGEGASPIVVLDLRLEDLGTEEIATLARTRPTASVLAVVGSPEEVPAALEAGALAAVEAGSESVVHCCRNLIRVFSHPQPKGTFGYGGRGGYSRFRRAIFDVQSGLLSATMALNLMHVISESVERAVLFLVQGEELRAVGAFGFSDSGESLAQLTKGLKLEPGPRCALRLATEDRKPRSVGFEEAELPEWFAEMLGAPANGQTVIFPVLGAERAISVIYTDNGALEDEIQDIKILELATSQVGVAFENELLRQEMEAAGLDPMAD